MLRNKQIIRHGEYCEIELTQGKFAKVDTSDLDRIMLHSWSIQKKSNALGHFCAHSKNGGKLHRFIMQPDSDMVVDHINGDTLDNRRCNLRICTREENAKNRKKRAIASSRYKGVSWNKSKKQWIAEISCDKQKYFLGYFDCEEKASEVYDRHARGMFGKFASLNFNH